MFCERYQNMARLKWFLVVPVLFLVCLQSSVNSSDNDHVCTEIRTYNITKRIKYQQSVTTVRYEWCLKFPPKCPIKQTEMRDKSKVQTEIRTEPVRVCCPGFGLKNDECIPICPPGVTGKTCNETCELGFWGKSCHKKCFCPNNAMCDVSDGKCICISGFVGHECAEPEQVITTQKKNLFDWSIPDLEPSRKEGFIIEDIISENVQNDVKTTTLLTTDVIPIKNVFTTRQYDPKLIKNSSEIHTTAKPHNYTMKTIETNQKSFNHEYTTDNNETKTFSPLTTTTYFKPITQTDIVTTTIKDSKIIYIKSKIWGSVQKNVSNTETKSVNNSKRLSDEFYYIKPTLTNISETTMATLGTSVKPTTITLGHHNTVNTTSRPTSTDESLFVHVIDKPNIAAEFETSTIPTGILATSKFSLNKKIHTKLPTAANTVRTTMNSDEQFSVDSSESREILSNLREPSNVTLFNSNINIKNHSKSILTNKNIYVVTTESTIKPSTKILSTTISSFYTVSNNHANMTTEEFSVLEETHQTLTEPEHITSVAGEKRSDSNKDDYISIVSTATGVAIAVILVAIVIVLIERYRRRSSDRDKQIGLKNMKSMMCNGDDEAPTYIRSIFHNPLPDPPNCPITTKTEPNSPFYRPVVIHAISPMMIENYRGILESHYDHLPSRDPRLASFQPISRPQSAQNNHSVTTIPTPSPIDNVFFQSFTEPYHYDPLKGPALRLPVNDNSALSMHCDNFNSSYMNEYSNEPLYDEIPSLQTDTYQNTTPPHVEAITEL